MYSLPVGTRVALTRMTDWSLLKELIAEYNELAANAGRPLVPEEIGKVRDALAHGRISSRADERLLRIIKFSKPRKGEAEVTVEFNEAMDTAWFARQIALVGQAMSDVHVSWLMLREE